MILLLIFIIGKLSIVSTIFVLIIDMLVSGFCCMWLSCQKGYDEKGRWFWYGFFGVDITLIILGLVIPNKELENNYV